MQYIYILMNYWILYSHKHDWQLSSLKTPQTCIKEHCLYIICSKCPSPAGTKISDELKPLINNEWQIWMTLLVNLLLATSRQRLRMHLRSRWRQTFLRWCKYDVIGTRHVWWFFRQYLPVVFVAVYIVLFICRKLVIGEVFHDVRISVYI